jgi:integrase
MFFQVAARNPDWEIAYWVASLTCNTGASGTELRNLQRKELHLDARVPFFFIKPETANNDGHGRPVVLNETALKQIRRCVERAERLGSTLPDHYLFPWRRARGKHDPTRPATAAWLRRPWKELCEAAGFPDLTPHCFRHQHITLRIESGAPIKLVAKDVGHSAVAMTRYYTNLRRRPEPRSISKIDPRSRFGTQRAVPPAMKKRG